MRLSLREKNYVKELLQERKTFTIAPIHLAAYMLDPRFRGEGLDDEEIIKAISFISTESERLGIDLGEAIANLGNFRSKAAFFAMPSLWKAAETLHPATWWSGLCANQPLAKLAANLLSLPPSTADVERGWSNYGFVHNKTRNRLTNDRTAKLVTVRAGLTAALPKDESSRKPLPVKILDQYLQDGDRREERGDGDTGEVSESDDDGLSEEEVDDDWTFDGDGAITDSDSEGEAEEREMATAEPGPDTSGATVTATATVPPPEQAQPTQQPRVTRATAAPRGTSSTSSTRSSKRHRNK
ncbi:uncharacterized protein LOC127749614 [Frankliniella occidentalis]|uniref:Uncharacterized protein LOC127749614 n=1 Tax=Frankliniella occidentalis TaxID=133901 RepID=A0A9C6U9R2_FRAOC|nr:uncharacterized protein LOC127749614 [Frankliniella occidentalis]